ncbi:MAG TPA: DUF2066 domain-containing protein [Rhodanobacteraceae bacterium]|jgi:hypothetical protein|nr:DUF2066 domain-containing protein [Rhodanobacteraceae bacterium]
MIRVLSMFVLALLVTGAAAAQTAAPATANSAPAAASSVAAPISPTPPANPYSVTVPVAGTADAQRDAAIGAALAQVLQQVSPGFAVTPDMQAQASGYVRDFRYRRGAAGSGLELQVDFDPGAISRLVASTAASPAPAASAGTAASGIVPIPTTPAVQQGTGTLWVAGISDSHAFATLLSILRGDDALHDVTPVAAAGDGVLISVDFEQPLATVLAALTGPGGHMTLAAQPHPGADATLQWNP